MYSMGMVSKEELERWIEQEEKDIVKVKEHWDEIIPEIIPIYSLYVTKQGIYQSKCRRDM